MLMYRREFLRMSQTLTKAFVAMTQPLCEAAGLPRPAFTALMYLGDYPEKNTSKDISEHCDIRPSLVSMYIEQMVSQGYLKRQTVPEDRRKVRLILTEKAQTVYRQRNECMQKFIRLILEGVSEEEIRVWLHFSQTVSDNANRLLQQMRVGEE